MRINSAWRYEQYAIDAENELSSRGASIAVGLCGTCPDCQSAYGMSPREFHAALGDGGVCEEGGFSNHDCDHCGQSLAGDRFAAHILEQDHAITHMDVCCDCIHSIANGESPQPTDIDEELAKLDDLIEHQFAWPGGYARYAVCSDGGVLCPACCAEEADNIKDSIDQRSNDEWRVEGYGCTADDDEAPVCDHCGNVVGETKAQGH